MGSILPKTRIGAGHLIPHSHTEGYLDKVSMSTPCNVPVINIKRFDYERLNVPTLELPKPPEQLGSGLADLVNLNPNAHPLMSGEKHMLLPTKYGPTFANFVGPGTHIDERVARGDVGVDGDDGIDIRGKYHDLAYKNAKDMGDIHKADKEFVSGVLRSKAPLPTRLAVAGAIQSKKIGEDLKIINPKVFSGNLPPPKPKKPKPGEVLKKLLVNKYKKQGESGITPAKLKSAILNKIMA